MKLYDLIAPFYEIAGTARYYRPMGREAVRQLRLTPGQTVLDVACGTGLNFELILGEIDMRGIPMGVTMDNLRARFRQANTWLILALLALCGWTVDALRMFLSMHETVWAGLGAFASHFWYAVPMAGAIVVLTRLQPKARLLGLAAYDEAGRLVHHQGDFRLDELTVRGMLTALRTNGRQGLHGFTLPSGANVYFVRQGGLTLMVSFSGPASPRELAASVQQLRPDRRPTFDLLDGLEPPVAALAANVLTSPVKRDVLAFFRQRRQTAIEAGDLAYWVNAGEDDVMHALDELANLGLVQPQCICDTTFYRLNQDPEAMFLLDRLFDWRNAWQMTLDRLEQAIGHSPTDDIAKRSRND